MEIDLFTNDNYRLLKLLYDNQTTVLEKRVVPLTQGEISEALGMSKAKVNIMFGYLQERGFVALESRGKYVVLEKGAVVIEDINELEIKIGGKKDE